MKTGSLSSRRKILEEELTGNGVLEADDGSNKRKILTVFLSNAGEITELGWEDRKVICLFVFRK